MLVEIPDTFEMMISTDTAIKLTKGPTLEELNDLALSRSGIDDESSFHFGAMGKSYYVYLDRVRVHPSVKGGWWLEGRLPSGRKVYVLWLPGFVGYGYLWLNIVPTTQSQLDARNLRFGLIM
ncbi:MAG: hypothetical protein PHT36_01580 [Patescibacteria group bacterium]|nr:hypothetical protein [Patescibacteria group bacterium]